MNTDTRSETGEGLSSGEDGASGDQQVEGDLERQDRSPDSSAVVHLQQLRDKNESRTV